MLVVHVSVHKFVAMKTKRCGYDVRLCTQGKLVNEPSETAQFEIKKEKKENRNPNADENRSPEKKPQRRFPFFHAFYGKCQHDIGPRRPLERAKRYTCKGR